jgi:prophage regulatory protein
MLIIKNLVYQMTNEVQKMANTTSQSNQLEKIQKKTRKKITYVPSELPLEGTVRLPSVIRALGISKNCFLAGVKAGIYPEGKLLSPRVRVWHVADLRKFLASLENGEDAA